MKTKGYFICVFFFWTIGANAQFFNKQNDWKTYRHEFSAFIGTSNYHGDLGGLNRDGVKWFIWDLELSTFKIPAFGGLYRNNIGPHSSISINFFRGKIMGSDALTQHPERNYRNLSFESTIYEVAAHYEFYFLKPSPGHIYNIKGVKGRNSQPWGLYAFAGIGGFYHNPKANGTPLRPLSTEGQGLPGGYGKKYGPIAISIPVGVGGEYRLLNWFKLGATLNYRFTTTDYLDDASTFFYDNQKLAAQKGAVAAQLADRSSGNKPGWTADGAIRGNPNNRDAFLHLAIQATFMLKNTPKGEKGPGRDGKHRFFKGKKRRLFKRKNGRPNGKHQFLKK